MDHIRFTKMHGIGNDYIYIDCLHACPKDLASLSREMSDRHFGVGGDGIILILPSDIADFSMRIFNADGSEARMCGNGARCVAKYVYDNKLTANKNITLETISGVKHLLLNTDADGYVSTVRVDMGIPSFAVADIPASTELDRLVNVGLETGCKDNTLINITALSVGNPHAVIFVDEVAKVNIERLGKIVENHRMFPERTNVEFVQINSRSDITMRVWERGSGVTMACGTGACASVAACVVNGLTDRHVTVHLDGGDLEIDWDRNNDHIYLTGSAATVFSGVYIRQNEI